MCGSVYLNVADTASEAQMCTDDYCADTVPALVTIQGVNSSATRTSIGCAFVRINDGSGPIFRLPMT